MGQAGEIPEVTRGPRRRFVRNLLTALIVLAILGASYFGAVFYQVWRQAHVDEAQPADAIVVLGAAQYAGRPSPVLKARLDHALALYRRGLASRIITTGGQGRGDEFTEAEVGRDYLAKSGVPEDLITIEAQGVSTLQSAAGVADIMDRAGLRSCIVVSDAYHILRIKRMLEDRGIVVYGSPRAHGDVALWRQGLNYARESAGYILWRLGIGA